MTIQTQRLEPGKAVLRMLYESQNQKNIENSMAEICWTAQFLSLRSASRRHIIPPRVLTRLKKRAIMPCAIMGLNMGRLRVYKPAVLPTSLSEGGFSHAAKLDDRAGHSRHRRVHWFFHHAAKAQLGCASPQAPLLSEPGFMVTEITRTGARAPRCHSRLRVPVGAPHDIPLN